MAHRWCGLSYVRCKRRSHSSEAFENCHPNPRRAKPAGDLDWPGQHRKAQQHVEQLAGRTGHSVGKRKEDIEANEGAETGDNCNDHGGYHD